MFLLPPTFLANIEQKGADKKLGEICQPLFSEMRGVLCRHISSTCLAFLTRLNTIQQSLWPDWCEVFVKTFSSLFSTVSDFLFLGLFLWCIESVNQFDFQLLNSIKLQSCLFLNINYNHVPFLCFRFGTAPPLARTALWPSMPSTSLPHSKKPKRDSETSSLSIPW